MSALATTDGRWRLASDSSTAEFRVRTLWGLQTVRGRFDRLDGALETDADGRRWMRLDIDAASLDTGNRRRDAHLRSADFFHADSHPEVRFRSMEVDEAGPDRLRVTGELSAAGECVPLELEPTVRATGDELEIEAEATVDQRLLGMTSRRLGIRSPATLTVRARLRRNGPPPRAR
jgi:polyisoprenoid-binding protein YceI